MTKITFILMFCCSEMQAQNMVLHHEGKKYIVGVEYIDSITFSNDEQCIKIEDYLQNSSVLIGKKRMAIGDSMVQGHSLSDAKGQTWLAKIAMRNNMTRINKGTNGSFMTKRAHENVNNSVYHKICDPSSELYVSDTIITAQDYIIIYAGTNDCAKNVPIGHVNSMDVTEFCGALNAICGTLQTRSPKSHIAFITPQIRRGIESRCQAYVDAVKAVCKKYHIPVFDQSENGGIDWNNEAIVKALTMGDTYHLNEDGMEFISLKYEHFIKGL